MMARSQVRVLVLCALLVGTHADSFRARSVLRGHAEASRPVLLRASEKLAPAVLPVARAISNLMDGLIKSPSAVGSLVRSAREVARKAQLGSDPLGALDVLASVASLREEDWLPTPSSFVEISQDPPTRAGFVGPCLFAEFPRQSFNLADAVTIPSEVVSATTQETCAEACAESSAAVGYQFSAPNTCTLLNEFVPNFEGNSAICVKRGGCDGLEESGACVWYELEDLHVGELFSAPTATVQVAHEAACRTHCEQVGELECVAYAFEKFAVPKVCKLYNVLASTTPLSSTAVCLRGLAFRSVPKKCWGGIACESDFVVTVPGKFGSPHVRLEAAMVPSDGGVVEHPAVRAQGGIVTFSGVVFEGDGVFTVSATTPGAQCPPLSASISIEDKTKHTFWRFQSEFEAERGFWVVQVGRDCGTIAFMLALFAIVAISLVIRLVSSIFSPTKIVVTIIMGALLGVFVRDYYHGWDHWGCADTITDFGSARAFRLVSPSPSTSPAPPRDL